MTYPDQLKTPVPARRPGYDALDDFLLEAAAWDPAVEEVWQEYIDRERDDRDRELVAAAQRLLVERRLTEPGMVYRLVQLLAEAGELGADALAAPASEPDEDRPGTALPPAGREREYAQGCDMAAQPPDGVRIVCVTGPAGVGKTHLAREIVAAVGPEGQVARLEVSLSSPALGKADHQEAKAPYDALLELLTQLGVHEADVPDSMAGRRTLYAAELASLRPVVLIDGARDASQVLPLLPRRQGSVVITSRRVLTGLAGLNAWQLPLRPMTEPGSGRLALEVFGTLGIEPPDRALTVVSERCDGLPGRIILLCRWMAVTAQAEDLALETLADRLDVTHGVDASAAAFPELLDEDQKAVMRVLGLLPLSGADITVIRLGTGLTQDRAQAALERLTRLGLIREDESGRGWVTAPLAVSGAEPVSAGQLPEAGYERVLRLYQLRTENLRDLLAACPPESMPSLRSWAGDRWQAERAGVYALLSTAADSGHPALARPLAAAFMDVAVRVEGHESGHREAEEAVASVLRIASDAGDDRLAGWAVTWLEGEVRVRGMIGPGPAASAGARSRHRAPQPEPSTRLEQVVAAEVTPRTGPVLFGTTVPRG
jgi:AAA ATPase domain